MSGERRAYVSYGDGQEFREVPNYRETVNDDGSVDMTWDPVPGVDQYLVTAFAEGDTPIDYFAENRGQEFDPGKLGP